MSGIERIFTCDTEQLALSLQHARVSAMQTSKGRFQAELTRLNLSGWNVQHISFLEGTTTCRGDAPPNDHAIIIPLRVRSDLRLLGKPLLTTSIGLYAPGGEHGDVMGAGAEQTVLVPPRAFIRDCLERVERIVPSAGAHHLHRPSNSLGPARAVLQDIQAAATSRPQALAQDGTARSFADRLSLSLLNALGDEVRETPTGRPPLPRASIIRRLHEMLERAADEPLFASEMCKELNISFPTLRRIFLEWYGLPPARYLLLRRYYLARRRLCGGAHGSVIDVAQSCGFWEPSRFAKSYRAIFGELPSATLRTTRFPSLC